MYSKTMKSCILLFFVGFVTCLPTVEVDVPAVRNNEDFNITQEGTILFGSIKVTYEAKNGIIRCVTYRRMPVFSIDEEVDDAHRRIVTVEIAAYGIFLQVSSTGPNGNTTLYYAVSHNNVKSIPTSEEYLQLTCPDDYLTMASKFATKVREEEIEDTEGACGGSDVVPPVTDDSSHALSLGNMDVEPIIIRSYAPKLSYVEPEDEYMTSDIVDRIVEKSGCVAYPSISGCESPAKGCSEVNVSEITVSDSPSSPHTKAAGESLTDPCLSCGVNVASATEPIIRTEEPNTEESTEESSRSASLPEEEAKGETAPKGPKRHLKQVLPNGILPQDRVTSEPPQKDEGIDVEDAHQPEFNPSIDDSLRLRGASSEEGSDNEEDRTTTTEVAEFDASLDESIRLMSLESSNNTSEELLKYPEALSECEDDNSNM